VSETITQSAPASASNPASGDQSVWQIDLLPVSGIPDRLAADVLADASDIGLPKNLNVIAARSFLVQGTITKQQAEEIAVRLLVEPVVEHCVVAKVGSDELSKIPDGFERLINVMPLPGVTDPQAESALQAIQDLNYSVTAVRTIKKYWISALDDASRQTLTQKLLCNDSIECTVEGPLQLDRLDLGREYDFNKTHVPLANVADEALVEISKQYQLSLSLAEMKTIQAHFVALDRDPVDVELECSKRPSLLPRFRFAKT